MNRCLKFRPPEQSGYTIVEVIVACAILAGVMIPTLTFIGRFRAQAIQKNRILAMQLAREEMEKALSQSLYESREKSVTVGNHTWHLRREVMRSMGLIQIRIFVLKPVSKRVLAMLETYRLETVE